MVDGFTACSTFLNFNRNWFSKTGTKCKTSKFKLKFYGKEKAWLYSWSTLTKEIVLFHIKYTLIESNKYRDIYTKMRPCSCSLSMTWKPSKWSMATMMAQTATFHAQEEHQTAQQDMWQLWLLINKKPWILCFPGLQTVSLLLLVHKVSKLVNFILKLVVELW